MTEAKDSGQIIIRDKALRGFVQVPIILVLDPQVSGNAKTAYGLLLWYEFRGTAFPGQAAMAEHLGRSERSLRNDLKELEEHGYLSVIQHGMGRPNTYIIESLQNRPVPEILDRQDPAGLGGKILPVKAARSCRSYKDDVEVTNQDSLSQKGDGEALASEFFAAIGEPKPSKKRRERACVVIHELTAEGFTEPAIREACRLAGERGARGPDLLPHVIGEAHSRVEAKGARRAKAAKVAELDDREREQREAAFSEELLAVDSLPPGERERLETECRATLPPGISEEFAGRILPGMIAARVKP